MAIVRSSANRSLLLTALAAVAGVTLVVAGVGRSLDSSAVHGGILALSALGVVLSILFVSVTALSDRVGRSSYPTAAGLCSSSLMLSSPVLADDGLSGLGVVFLVAGCCVVIGFSLIFVAQLRQSD